MSIVNDSSRRLGGRGGGGGGGGVGPREDLLKGFGRRAADTLGLVVGGPLEGRLGRSGLGPVLAQGDRGGCANGHIRVIQGIPQRRDNPPGRRTAAGQRLHGVVTRKGRCILQRLDQFIHGARGRRTQLGQSAGGLCAQPPRVLVEAWNGEPPVGGEAESLLEPLGFRREALALVWDGL